MLNQRIWTERIYFKANEKNKQNKGDVFQAAAIELGFILNVAVGRD